VNAVVVSLCLSHLEEILADSLKKNEISKGLALQPLASEYLAGIDDGQFNSDFSKRNVIGLGELTKCNVHEAILKWS
jgi:hypothetical protein